MVIQKPEIVAGMIKKAKRAVMVIGHQSLEIDLPDGKALDYFIRIADAGKTSVVATGHTISGLVKRGYTHAYPMPAVDIANRLQDPDWMGLDGGGRYDLALFVGLPYYMEWTILSGLKHIAAHLKTVSLDRYYQPHATWSFPNISIDVWETSLKTILNRLGAEGLR